MSLRSGERTEARRSKYKVAIDADEGRRRREDAMVGIRKKGREENLQKKRREGLHSDNLLSTASVQPSSASEINMENLHLMAAGAWSEDRDLQLDAAKQFRTWLSLDHNPPIEEVVESGVVPRLVQFLMREDFPKLQFEAAWALTNIAAGASDYTNLVVNLGAVPIFVRLLSSPDVELREQAIWALGNIAGDSTISRDLILADGALPILLAQFDDHASTSMLRNATWALSSFCRGKPQPTFDLVKTALSVLKLLIQMGNEEILTDACWALSYLSDGTNDKIQAVIDADICHHLVPILHIHQYPSVLVPALRTVGNIVTGDDLQTQVIIDCEVLPSLQNLLSSNFNKNIKKEACWVISNITAGNSEQIQAVIDAGIIGSLVLLLQHAEFGIKKEVAWAISNAAFGGTKEQIKYLVSEGCIKSLCDLLVCPDPRIIAVCLEGLECVLKVGQTLSDHPGAANIYAEVVEDAEGLDKIDALQEHDNSEIYEKAVKILETYWEKVDDEIMLDNLPQSEVNPADGFNFG